MPRAAIYVVADRGLNWSPVEGAEVITLQVDNRNKKLN